MTTLQTLAERLRSRNWRLTAQRRVIADVLQGEHVHMSADEVLTAARSTLPEVSLATVYNTLNELVELGEVLELVHTDGRKRYDPNVGERHHHLVCGGCGQMYDVALRAEPVLPVEQQHGFDLHDVAVTFTGRCAACAKTAASTG